MILVQYRRLKETIAATVLVALASAGVSFGQEAAAGARPVSGLIPAAMGIRTDKQGNSWNIETNGTIGRIGSTMVNSGLVLSVNDETFASFQPMMSRDGNEFVLRGRPIESIPGLQVQRRIKLITSPISGAGALSGDDAGGGLRFAEIFYNGSTDPISFTVGLTTNFSGNYKHFLSDRGTSEPVILGEGESGIIVLPGASQSTKAFLFSLADAGSAIKPTISAQNRYGLTFRYQVNLAPGETGVILHRVAQVMIPGNFDRRTLLRLFSPYALSHSDTVLDSQWDRFVLNVSSDRVGLNEHFPIAGFEALEMEPAESDTLAVGGTTRLPGTASSPGVVITTPFGDAEVALDSIAAITGGKFAGGGKERLYLRDGQILSGSISAPDFVFKQKSGTEMVIEIAKLDRLVLAAKPVAEPKTARTLLETFGGDRLLLNKLKGIEIKGITPWGVVPIPLDQITSLHPDVSSPGYRVHLLDGSELRVFPGEDHLPLEIDRLGSVEIPQSIVRSLVTEQHNENAIPFEPEAGKSAVQLSGYQKVIGSVGNSEIVLVSDQVPITTPSAEIRRLTQTPQGVGTAGVLSAKKPTFRLERWDGGIVEGTFSSGVFSVSVEEVALSIPAQDVEMIEMPLPALNDENTAKIKELVELLGNSSWAERERATLELGAFGYLAGSVLRRERQQTDDVEVARRIDRVLKELD